MVALPWVVPRITIVRRDDSPAEEVRGREDRPRERIFSRQGSPCGDLDKILLNDWLSVLPTRDVLGFGQQS